MVNTACLDWEQTRGALDRLRAAVRVRRQHRPANGLRNDPNLLRKAHVNGTGEVINSIETLQNAQA